MAFNDIYLKQKLMDIRQSFKLSQILWHVKKFKFELCDVPVIQLDKYVVII